MEWTAKQMMAVALARQVEDGKTYIIGTGLPLIGVVPEDANVTLAAAFEKPLLKQSKRGAATAACRRIAKRVQGLPVPIDL